MIWTAEAGAEIARKARRDRAARSCAAAIATACACCAAPVTQSHGAVLRRDGSRLAVDIGSREGLVQGDTCLFVRYSHRADIDPDWEGFGRVLGSGPDAGGSQNGSSSVAVIADYLSRDQHIDVVPYPSLGLQVGLGAAYLPMRHAATSPSAGGAVYATRGGLGQSLELRYRVGRLPVTEVYLTATALALSGVRPLGILFLEPGLEKVWLVGRLSPLIGARYSLGRYAMPVPAGARNATGVATGHGIEGYAGVNLYLAPSWLLQLAAGYRYHTTINQFSYGNHVYFFRDDRHDVWTVSPSGVSGRVSVTYEI
jgi:hypothetical protein